jgi:predicted kinase
MISSDVVRKQLAGVPLTERHFNEMNSGLYSPALSRRTYDRLLEEAKAILKLGDSVILDASFIKSEERTRARELAADSGVDFLIVECRLDEEETHRRLERRVMGPSISDGRWELYGPQKSQFEPVSEVPLEEYLTIDTGKPLEEQISHVIKSVIPND